ncbi:hypothetical protein [Austwickia chelonae]|uniref:hypothetical protein n=1 Tax=Austwickia chelonae TaxID=100225 RepID=UPI0013C30020|nr:hypothetical protein [Austwickia chelonae]
MVKVISTVPAYRAMAAIEDEHDRQDAWMRLYESAHEDVFARYYSSWGRTECRVGAAGIAPQLVATIEARERRMRAVLASMNGKLAEHGVEADDLEAVLMVGGHTSNG